jgi:hypothetical protein
LKEYVEKNYLAFTAAVVVKYKCLYGRDGGREK